MQRHMMLDSGAFSVRFSGHVVDIDDYIRFCLDHPAFSYCVNLDTIPGDGSFSPFSGQYWAKSRTDEKLESCAKESWKSYLKMIRHLPMEKVIPVFHKGENWNWLEKYIDFGTPYIGISGVNMGGYDSKRRYLDQVSKYVFASDGTPIVKTHGFAVTDWKMVRYMAWTSVDSATWTKAGGYGNVFIPRSRSGRYVYDEDPFIVGTTYRSPYKRQKEMHLTNIQGHAVEYIERYLRSLKMDIGKYEVFAAKPSYELKDNEVWANKQKTEVMRILQPGICTCHKRRYFVNTVFMQRMEQATKCENIYLAGAESGVPIGMERRFYNRLMSYARIRSTGSNSYRNFCRHLEWISEGEKTLCE